MEHRAGEEVTFTAQRPVIVRGHKYETGAEWTFRLAQDWNEEDGLGEGGAWGYGGYSTARLMSLIEQNS